MSTKKKLMRAYRADEVVGEMGTAMRFVASTSEIARDNMIIDAKGWELDNYKLNPVILWAHDLFGKTPPIGRGDAFIDGKNLMVDIIFDQDDAFAVSVERKYRKGFLNALSVQWETLEVEPAQAGQPFTITRAELLEISAVPVPADPLALKERGMAEVRTLRSELGEMLVELGEKVSDVVVMGAVTRVGTRVSITGSPLNVSAYRPGVVKPHNKGTHELEYEFSDERDFPASHDLSDDKFGELFAYVGNFADDQHEFYLLHHSKDGKAVWRSVAACMVDLYCGTAGVPDEAVRGVYEHLARHYQQFGKIAPEYIEPVALRAYTGAMRAGLFLEGEAETFPDQFSEPLLERGTRSRVREGLKAIRSLVDDLYIDLAGDETPEPTSDVSGVELKLKQIDDLLSPTQGEK